MTGGPTIDYEALHQEAMRGVVRTILMRTAKSGLPGDHHFYISFDTQATGVVLSKRLKEKYPNEMTIVLQHRFWDLAVSEERFEVKLTFEGIPERLVVPFTAIKVFFDPSVRYGLQFEEPDQGEAALRDGIGDETGEERPATRNNLAPRKPRPPARTKTRGEREAVPGAGPGETRTAPLKPLPATRLPGAKAGDKADAGSEGDRIKPADKVPAPAAAASQQKPGASEEGKSAVVPAPAGNGGAQIVSLDAFRKK